MKHNKEAERLDESQVAQKSLITADSLQFSVLSSKDDGLITLRQHLNNVKNTLY